MNRSSPEYGSDPEELQAATRAIGQRILVLDVAAPWLFRV